VILFEDETTRHWFPPPRCRWSRRGEQAKVRITGRNAERVLFGTINPQTGHRVVLRRMRSRREDFQAVLQLLRQRYGNRPPDLLLDRAPGHEAAKSQALAARLEIASVWSPKRCSELDAMDHLWRSVQKDVSADRQWPTVDEHADQAERWVLGLSNREALRQAGILSGDFRLRNLWENFWLPT